ncbi:hypothetical protein A5798_001235 [Enterococcus sp. 6C8_DIV0013]|uniref:hypothetical protein n=1 Tax=Vagococcus fluvialis TaxID=2738 RepID=UPI000A35117A|nr:hypothetical protein [Vagococcus fluvialis]OTP31213.1 hypothetical protein A5798_001235 [Enterococcus sp. 6C8_DIV0013]
MGEFNLLQWTGEYFIQIPSGLKEKGLEANNLMAIIRDVFTSKEISQLDEMESVSASFPLKKKTAKEVIGKIAKDAADEGLSFLVDTLIETTLDMGTDKKRSLFSELFTMVMDEEERSYIASIGKYEKDQLFFESIVPTSESIQSLFHTEYEADFFVAHIALNTYEANQEFSLETLEKTFEEAMLEIGVEGLEFTYNDVKYPLKRLETGKLSYNLFTMDLNLEEIS